MPDITLVIETTSVVEDSILTVSNAVDVSDNVSTAEFVDTIDGLFFINKFEPFTIAEDLIVDVPILLQLFADDVGVTDEGPQPIVRVGLALIAFDITSLAEFKLLGRDPEILSVVENLSITEFKLLGYTILSLSIFDLANISEIAFKQTVADSSFSQFARSYPFEEETMFNILTQVFENGSEQRRDKWGKKRKSFTVQFAPRIKTDIDLIKQFFEQNSGSSNLFNFTSPLDGIVYTVKFENQSLTIQRIAFNVYQASVQLTEVF